MFKTLEIKNFKSISHATFDLGKINVLTGQSNLGKSNVVQAIYCLTHNHWDSNYLKWGEKKCSIRLTDETGEFVEYRHNESTAEYTLSTVDQPFTKIGRDVPQPVRDFLQMNLVQFDEDLTLDFNFERQFDPSFVVSLSGFELAKVFGKLMNLDIVLSASRNINKDLMAIRKEMDVQEAIENVSIGYIQKNYSIELKYALLQQAILIDGQAEQLDSDIARLYSILIDLEFYQGCVEAYSSFIKSDDNALIDTIHEPITGLDDLLASLITAQETISVYLSAITQDVPTFDFDQFFRLETSLTDIIHSIARNKVYHDQLSDVSQIDFDLVNSLLEKKQVLDALVQWEVECDHEQVQGNNKEKEITKKKKEFTEFLKQNNICPISGRAFEQGCMQRIVENV